MRYISLFSGIEAASAAWMPLGWECVALSEIDPYCNAVLEKRVPGAPNVGDIREAAPASRSRSRGSARGSRGNRGSCSNIFEQFKASVRLALCGKTSRERSRAREGRLSDACCGRWMRSGMAWRGAYWTRSSSTWPSGASVCSLSECLEAQPVPQKYCLSPRACAGILRRANARGKSLPPLLEDALLAVARCSSDAGSPEAVREL